MKYVVKLRKVTVQETVFEFEHDGPITKAMDWVEEVVPIPYVDTTEGEWKVVSINTKKEEQ